MGKRIVHWVSVEFVLYTTEILIYADRAYEMRQLRIFQKMVEKGQIYRQHRPVHYSPSSRTALAEAELEYSDNHVSRSVYVTFELDNFSNSGLQSLALPASRVRLLVWTTTPWTLSANMVRPTLLCATRVNQSVHRPLQYTKTLHMS